MFHQQVIFQVHLHQRVLLVLETAGDALIKGNLTFGDAATDFVSFGADVTSDFIPNASDSHNLGSNAQRWDTLFLSGSVSASGGDHFINASGAGKKVDIDAAGAVQIFAEVLSITFPMRSMLPFQPRLKSL